MGAATIGMLALWLGAEVAAAQVIGGSVAAESAPPGPADARAAVRAWVEDLVLPTYPVGAPEKNPIFYSGRTYQGAKGPMYPYPLLDDLSESKVDRTYRAVRLENRWISVSILPELGGRIFSAVDKTNGHDFIYRQSVIKPSLIGMVGAWISGGIEWNVPHHHRASTFLPVHWRITEGRDGSRTVWVGETELRHRMKWVVGITLRPDRNWLEATVKVFNRTPLAHSILYFANVAVHAGEDYQVIFPPGTEWGTQHAKREFVRWPVGDGVYAGVDYRGVDLSWWKNHARPVSIFAWNDVDDWFGGYDHGRDAGIAHVADRHQVPGKKFFEFANGPEGRMWDSILTDTDGPYLELMSGAWSDNQPDYSWCLPGETKTASEVWYPVRDLGGIRSANLEGALNLEVDREKGIVRAAFNSTAERRGARVVLLVHGGQGDGQGGTTKTLFAESIDIAPDRPWSRAVPLPAGVEEEALEVWLEADGRRLVACRPTRPLGQPKPASVVPPLPPAEIRSNEELYFAGSRLAQFYSPAFEPDPFFEEAIRRDPGDARANTALGLLLLQRLSPREAEARLRAAVERVTANHTRPKDTEALYYLGIALAMQGRDGEAEEVLERATWDAGWASPAWLALAESASRRGDLDRALEFLSRAVARNSRYSRALALEAVILLKKGRAAEALAVTEGVLVEVDPLDFVAWRTKGIALLALGRESEGKAERAALAATLGGDTQAHLEMAFQYLAAGFRRDAIEVLESFGTEGAVDDRTHPMVYYTLATLYPGPMARVHAAQGARVPPDLCFPFRHEERLILEEIAAAHPEDAHAPFYLGNLLYDHRPLDAIAAWERARELDPRMPTVHRNLGLAYARRGDVVAAVASLERAVECDPTDARVLAELDAAYEAAGADLAKRLASLEARPQVVEARDETLQRRILLHLLVGRVDEAARSLDGHRFHLWEGGEEDVANPHDLYVDARLLRGRGRLLAGQARAALADFESALEYPERFEIGRPFHGGRDVEVHWHRGLALEALGDAAGARAAFELAAAGGGRDESGALGYFRGLALRRLGKESEAAGEFDRLVKTGEAEWAAKPRVDFFAKFGAGASDAARKARARVLLGLGLLGRGDREGAVRAFEEAVRLDPVNLRARTTRVDP